MTLAEKVRARNSKQGKENFKNGMAFEFKVLAKEKKLAMVAIRSAGSHSLADIMSIRKNEVRLISIRKNGFWSEQEINDLLDLQEKSPANNQVYLAYYEDNKYKIHKI